MKRILTILVFCVFTSLSVWGQQSVEALQREKAAAEAELRAINELLSKTETDRKNNRSLLDILLQKINSQKRLVSSLDTEIGLINRAVNAKTHAVEQMEADLTALKTEYASMIRSAYKSQQTNNVLAFLFASDDFNDMTQRIFYIKRYTAMRERKAEQIDSISRVLQSEIAELALQRDSLNNTVRTRNNELSNLNKNEQEYRQIDTSLRSQATQYNRRIAEQQRRIKNIQDQIQRIIAEEARRAQATPRNAAEEEAFVLLTGRFDQNRGSLPYPVSGGVIVEKYGSHPHATQRGVTVNNKGVNIAAPKGADVRAVFEGEVVRVFFTPGANNTVMIRHGSYFTTYSNLETVSVKAGDKVSINQTIGKIYSGPNAENYILPFTIWNGTQTQNPELWLRR